MSTTTDHIKSSLKQSYTYQNYEKLIADLLEQGKSTTKNGDEAFVDYSKLGLQRMKRWDKRFKLGDEATKKIKEIDRKQTWIVIAEGWCGDAAHTVPVIHKMSEANSQIDLRIVLREENPNLMNDFLTNGGKSIPKLIMYDPERGTLIADWGPRPAPAQQIFKDYKNKSHDDFEQAVQAWYNKDKGQTTAEEIVALTA